MVRAIANFILRSRINRENSARQKKFLPWDRIDKLALIVEHQENLNKSVVDRFIEDTKKYVEVFYIETKSKHPSFSDWYCFSKKDASLLHLPKKEKITELHHKKFDAVINTCSETNLFAMAVSNSLPASLKCSATAKFHLADLIIKKAEPFSLKNYLDETVRYLKMIKA